MGSFSNLAFGNLENDSPRHLDSLASPNESFEKTAEKLFDSFGQVIPYDRIGIALISNDRETLSLYWMKSKTPAKALKAGFSIPLKGSSLEKIIISQIPRILDDLNEYIKNHPDSDSTKRALADGIQSSLTCPLQSTGRPLGLIFFSSFVPHAYSNQHLQIYSLIANTIANSIERELSQSSQSILLDREAFYRKALHDLGNSLTVLKANVDMTLRNKHGELNPELNRAIDFMRKQTESMTDLLNDIQDTLEFGTANFTVRPQSVELSAYLDTIEMAAESLANNKHIHFRLVRGPHLGSRATFDPQRITQVIGNLLTNATKFSRPQTEIILHVDKTQEGRLKFSLRDQGIGIARLDLPKLFEPQLQVKKSTPTEFERCRGLGLSIVKKIINDHKGTIWVESELGIGSTFFFELPQKSVIQP